MSLIIWKFGIGVIVLAMLLLIAIVLYAIYKKYTENLKESIMITLTLVGGVAVCWGIGEIMNRCFDLTKMIN